jgi:hypothetical protein
MIPVAKTGAEAVGRWIAWAGLSAVLLLAGFALLLLGSYTLSWLAGNLPTDRIREIQAGFVVSFAVIALKGLLPQMLVAAAASLALRRCWADLESGWRNLVLGSAGAASLAYALAVPALLFASHRLLPALVPRGPRDHFFTFLLMTGGVTAAMVIAHAALYGRPAPAAEDSRSG